MIATVRPKTLKECVNDWRAMDDETLENFVGPLKPSGDIVSELAHMVDKERRSGENNPEIDRIAEEKDTESRLALEKNIRKALSDAWQKETGKMLIDEDLGSLAEFLVWVEHQFFGLQESRQRIADEVGRIDPEGNTIIKQMVDREMGDF